MSIERIKTLILTLLILICITLGVQVWFEEKLWSEDYNFFSVIFENITSLFKDEKASTNINVTGALDSIFSPRNAVLSYSDGRVTVDFTDEKSKELRNTLNSVIRSSITQNASLTSEENWQSALTSQSIFADFSVPVSFNAMGDFLGVKNTVTSFTSFDKIAVVTNSVSPTGEIQVYFCNSGENKYLVSTIDANDNLNNVYNSYSNKEKHNIAYAFELNLDKKLNEDTHQKIIFDSYVRLNLDPVNLNIIENEHMDVLNEEIAKNLMKVFNMNYKSSKKYTQSDTTTLYVDSNCTLTLHPNGIIEYEALEGKGFKVSEDYSLSSSAAGGAKLLDDLFSCLKISENTRIFINSPLVEDEKETYTFDFDYLYDSTPIYSNVHGCTINIKDGRITYLKANIKNYNLVSEGKESNPLDVLDIIYETMGEREIKINNLYFGYFDKNGQTTLSWQVQIEGSDDVLIIN